MKTVVGTSCLFRYLPNEHYSYFPSQQLNAYNVIQGEKAIYYSDIGVVVNNKTILISLSEKCSDNYQNKEIENNRKIWLTHVKIGI